MTEELIQATHGAADHPLRIGDLEIPCYVLENGQRVLVQGGLIAALDMKPGGPNRQKPLSGDRLTRFVNGKVIQPYVNDTVMNQLANPIRFCTPNGAVANGYEATILMDICEAVLTARQEGKLQKQQGHIAKQCEILMRGFARVGIIALVDEATGYQEFRARQALEEILKKFISDELMKWAKTFPDEFYRGLYRLKGLTYYEVSTKRPPYLGHITNDIIYARLAPGVLEELKRITPKTESGKRKHKFHQRLTNDVGHPKLHEHLLKVMTLMDASPNYEVFYRLLQRALPKYGTTLPLPFNDYDE